MLYRNVFWLGVATALERGLTLAAFAAAAAALEPSAFGVAAFAQAVSFYVYSLVELGLPITLVKSAAERQRNSARLIVPTIVTRLAASSLVGLALWFGVSATIGWGESGAAIMLFFAASAAASFSVAWLFQGLQRTHWLVITEGLRGALTVAAVARFVNGPGDMLRLPLILVATTLVSGLLQVGIAWWCLRSLRTDWPAFGEIFNQLLRSAPVGVGGLLVQTYFQLNILLLKHTGGAFETGVYAGCVRLAAVPLSVAALLGIAVLPPLTEVASRGQRALSAVQWTLLRRIAAIVIPAGLVACWIAPRLLTRTLGTDYSSGVPALRLLVVFVVVSTLNLPFAQSLIATGRVREYFVGVALGATTNLAVSIPLIGSFGAAGAAAGSTLGAVVASAWLFLKATDRI